MGWPALLQMNNALSQIGCPVLHTLHFKWTGQRWALLTFNGLASLTAGESCPITDGLASVEHCPPQMDWPASLPVSDSPS